VSPEKKKPSSRKNRTSKRKKESDQKPKNWKRDGEQWFTITGDFGVDRALVG
jgi:hypothetical protein